MEEREREIMKLSFTPLPHASISLSSIHNSRQTQNTFGDSLIFASSADYSTSFLKVCVSRGGDERSKGESLNLASESPDSGVKQQNMTDDGERVIAAAKRLVRHITVFSEIHMRVCGARTYTFFFFQVGVREVHNGARRL